MIAKIAKPSVVRVVPDRLKPNRLASGSNSRFVTKVARWSWVTLLLAGALQCILFQSTANWVGVLYIVVVWFILVKVFLRPEVLEKFPFSTFLIIGFTSTQFYFPLVFTLLEGKPVVFNLELPYDVFFHSTAAFLVLVLAHTFYRLTYKDVNKRQNSLLEKMGVFTPPNFVQLYLMGFIGIAAAFYTYIYTAAGWSHTGAASDKFIESLIPFSYAPYFIPFGRLYNGKQGITKKTLFLLALFTLLLFINSVARNQRTGFIMGFTSLGFAYALGILFDFFKPRFFTLRNALFAVFGLWFVMGPVADISTAMVMVRGERRNVPPAELLEQTAEAFFDKEGIRQYRRQANDATQNRGWDEHYVDNIFLARFCNLKYNDLSLMMAARVSIPDVDMLNHTRDHFLTTLPTPFLNLLGINIDKEFVQGNSYGDFFLYKVDGNPWVLNAFRTGHLSGVSLATFGWWYLVIFGIGVLPVFVLFDKLSMRQRLLPARAKAGQYTVGFSLCGLLILTDIFRFIPTESVEGIWSYLFRGWPQTVLLYCLLYHATRLVSNVLPGASRRPAKPVRIERFEKVGLS